MATIIYVDFFEHFFSQMSISQFSINFLYLVLSIIFLFLVFLSLTLSIIISFLRLLQWLVEQLLILLI